MVTPAMASLAAMSRACPSRLAMAWELSPSRAAKTWAGKEQLVSRKSKIVELALEVPLCMRSARSQPLPPPHAVPVATAEAVPGKQEYLDSCARKHIIPVSAFIKVWPN